MFCQVQAAVQTEAAVVVFQHFRQMCGKQAMETNFYTQKVFCAKYKAVCAELRRQQKVVDLI